MTGLINFYKPPGMTSAQAVAFIKRLTRTKTGHAGTLDPEAAGVLPILLGRATRISEHLMAMPKQYLAEIAFGAATDTQDAQGLVIARGDRYPDLDSLRAALPAFQGAVSQLPPQYSALKVDGKTAYQLARAGKQAKLQPREVWFESIQVLRAMPNQGFLLRVRCGKGAYIRTLCHDLGDALGCPAHLRFLLREESGGLLLAGSRTPEEVRAWAEGGCKTDQSMLLPVATALGRLPRVQVPDHLLRPAINGVALPIAEFPGFDKTNQHQALLFAGERLVGLFRRAGDLLRVDVMFYEPESGKK